MPGSLGRWRRWVLAGMLGSGAAGCGYSTRSLVPEQYRRVYLPVFRNETFYRDLEIELTREVAEELASRPGIFIVGPEEADIVLTGTILQFEPRVLAEDELDRVRESSATTTVRIEIQDARNPGHVHETYQVTDRAEFFLEQEEDLASATGESFFDLARKIVNELETQFPRPSRRTRGESAGRESP